MQGAGRQCPAVPRAVVAEELVAIGVAALRRAAQRRPQRGAPRHVAGAAGDLAAVRREAVVAVEVQEDGDDRAVGVRGDLHTGVPGQVGAGQSGAGGGAGARDQAVRPADLLGARLQDGAAEELGQVGAVVARRCGAGVAGMQHSVGSVVAGAGLLPVPVRWPGRAVRALPDLFGATLEESHDVSHEWLFTVSARITTLNWRASSFKGQSGLLEPHRRVRRAATRLRPVDRSIARTAARGDTATGAGRCPRRNRGRSPSGAALRRARRRRTRWSGRCGRTGWTGPARRCLTPAGLRELARWIDGLFTDQPDIGRLIPRRATTPAD